MNAQMKEWYAFEKVVSLFFYSTFTQVVLKKKSSQIYVAIQN